MIGIALILGLAGSLHCIGMCGPLALGVSQMGPTNWSAMVAKGLSYNLGRASTYGVLGLLLGSFSDLFLQNNGQQWLSLVAGGLILLLFFLNLSKRSGPLPFPSVMGRLEAQWQHQIGLWMHRYGSSSVFILGLLNGLIPCGLVYVALAGAVSLGTGLIDSALFMFFFGLGTIPALFALGLGSHWVPRRWRSQFFPVLQFAMGVLLIYRGLSIEIPTEFSLQMFIQAEPDCH